jgi:hypothetical protein
MDREIILLCDGAVIQRPRHGGTNVWSPRIQPSHPSTALGCLMAATITNFCHWVFGRSSFYLAVSSVVALAACSQSDISAARKAEAEERFSDAYQTSSKILYAASKSVSLPEQKLWKSWGDVKGWIEESLAAYTKFALNKPSASDLKESLERLKRTEPQLTSLESELRIDKSAKLSIEGFAAVFQALRFPDQKIVPKVVREAAAGAYNDRLSVVLIKGDGVSYVEGGLYNEENNISAKYSLTSSPFELNGGAILLLRPGRWVAVSRIIPSLSNPEDKLYLQLNGIRGVYGGAFFSVPNESHLMVLRFCSRASRC